MQLVNRAWNKVSEEIEFSAVGENIEHYLYLIRSIKWYNDLG
jgi:hypothetical protein